MQRTPLKKVAKPEAPAARLLSPRRKTTQATTLHKLAVEQLEHFHIDPKSPAGQPLLALAEKLYGAHGDVMDLWEANTLVLCPALTSHSDSSVISCRPPAPSTRKSPASAANSWPPPRSTGWPTRSTPTCTSATPPPSRASRIA